MRTSLLAILHLHKCIKPMLESPAEVSLEGLHHLLRRLQEGLRGLPGFRTLSLFGSLAEGRADGYSDLDLLVATDDLSAAQTHLLGTLEEIAPVEFCWVIKFHPDEWNPTIVFRKEGYYHKLDIGLVSAGNAERTIPEAQTVLLAEEGRAQDRPLPESLAYFPAHGSAGHFLLGQFLGGTRYVKARKRGQRATCYRFVSAMADWRLRACYAQLTGEYTLQAKLSTTEYQALDRLAAAGSPTLLNALDYSTPAAMDRALCVVFDELSRHCQAIAAAQEELLPDELSRRMISFLRRELEVSSEGTIP
ncbi:MAG: nucleotidyltransferase domain-containing protein [Armatimonadota bacterium]